MSHPPVPVGEISSPVSAREALADRFLGRVAGLTPEEWGRLDAIAQREHAGDPLARWRHARRFVSGDVGGALAATVIAGLSLVVDVAGSVLVAVSPSRARALAAPRARRPLRDVALDRRLATLRDTARARAGGEGDATHILIVALVALWERHRLPRETFVRWYELVEPVIPLDSLER